jgi:hypothetical protein
VNLRRLSLGAFLLVGSLLLTHLLDHYGFEMEPVQKDGVVLSLTDIMLPDWGANVTFVRFSVDNYSTRPFPIPFHRGSLEERSTPRELPFTLFDGAGNVRQQLAAMAQPIDDKVVPPHTHRAIDVMFESIDRSDSKTLRVIIPFLQGVHRINRQLPELLYYFTTAIWLLPMIMIAGGILILVGSWSSESFRGVFISVLGMLLGYAVLHRTLALQSIPLFVGALAVLVIVALVVSYGSRNLPLPYPASFYVGGYLLVVVGLLLCGYFLWLMFDEPGELVDSLFLFLSVAFTLYVAPSVNAFRGVGGLLLLLLVIQCVTYGRRIIYASHHDILWTAGGPQVYGLVVALSLIAILVGLGAVPHLPTSRPEEKAIDA